MLRVLVFALLSTISFVDVTKAETTHYFTCPPKSGGDTKFFELFTNDSGKRWLLREQIITTNLSFSTSEFTENDTTLEWVYDKKYLRDFEFTYDWESVDPIMAWNYSINKKTLDLTVKKPSSNEVIEYNCEITEDIWVWLSKQQMPDLLENKF